MTIRIQVARRVTSSQNRASLFPQRESSICVLCRFLEMMYTYVINLHIILSRHLLDPLLIRCNNLDLYSVSTSEDVLVDTISATRLIRYDSARQVATEC